MLEVIGLALDLIGGGVVLLGLFRHAKPLYPGWARPPAEAAEDRSYGAIGFLFLGGGFLLQALPYLGVHQSTNHHAVAVGGGATLGLGVLVAWAAFDVAFLGFFTNELRQIPRRHGLELFALRKPTRWRVFNYEIHEERVSR
jgi:hypothetical protein